MPDKTVVVNVRLDKAMLERVENYRARLEDGMKIEVSRSAAIKRLLNEALDSEDSK